MTDGVYTIGEIRAMVLPLLRRYDMESASLFGSYARGEADADSDIDVFLKGEPGFRGFDIFGVGEELSIASGKRVDVHEVSELVDVSF